MKEIAYGEDVIKYGSPIGHASDDIEICQWVHTHNTKTNLSGVEEYEYHPKEVGEPRLEHLSLQ